jgi:RNA polymerase sigma factor (sigma-70 family)
MLGTIDRRPEEASLVSNAQRRSVFRDVQTLFDVGATGRLTDGQLLERFTARGGATSESAFAALVDRHGPMVLSACRAILRDRHEADDAFQATFLVLVRRARSLWVRDSLGPWLHAVAHRVASRARSDHVRRRAYERNAAVRKTSRADIRRDDGLVALLHEEIGRLPERYRAVIVLCYLEGLTQEQAARRLGWPFGTVRSRLARGKARLQDRLAWRGLIPSVGISGALFALQTASAAVPASLAHSTVQAAVRYAASRAFLAGILSATSVVSTKGVLKTMFASKLKVAAFGLLLTGATSTGFWVFKDQAIASSPRSTESKSALAVAAAPVRARSTFPEELALADPPVPSQTAPSPIVAKSGNDDELNTIALKGKLNEPVSLNMTKLPLSRALAYLASYTGLQIAFDTKAFDELDPKRNAPVDAVAANVPLRTALRMILEPLGLEFTAGKDGTLSVTKLDDENRRLIKSVEQLQEDYKQLAAEGVNLQKASAQPPGEQAAGPSTEGSDFTDVQKRFELALDAKLAKLHAEGESLVLRLAELRAEIQRLDAIRRELRGDHSGQRTYTVRRPPERRGVDKRNSTETRTGKNQPSQPTSPDQSPAQGPSPSRGSADQRPTSSHNQSQRAASPEQPLVSSLPDAGSDRQISYETRYLDLQERDGRWRDRLPEGFKALGSMPRPYGGVIDRGALSDLLSGLMLSARQLTVRVPPKVTAFTGHGAIFGFDTRNGDVARGVEPGDALRDSGTGFAGGVWLSIVGTITSDGTRLKVRLCDMTETSGAYGKPSDNAAAASAPISPTVPGSQFQGPYDVPDGSSLLFFSGRSARLFLITPKAIILEEESQRMARPR